MKNTVKTWASIAIGTFMLASCTSTINTPSTSITSTAASSKQRIQTNELIGAWALTTKDSDPYKVINLTIMHANHQGMDYAYIQDRKTGKETQHTQLFKWTFDENSNTFTQKIYKTSTTETGKPDKISDTPKTETATIQMIKQNHKNVAIQFNLPQQEVVYLKMDDKTIRKTLPNAFKLLDSL